MGFDMHGLVNLRIEYDLGDALAIAQIDKNDPAVIPPAQNPAHQHHFFANICGAQLTTAVGSSHIS
jgi:hypothetical protein